MKQRLLTLNSALLMLCCSMYLGTGWSLVLFSFPIAPSLTPDNYHMQFVPQVTAATQFFTYMTMVMIATAIVMLIAEWRTRFRWTPMVVLLGVLAATGLTMVFIIPYNKEMAAGITEQARVTEVLDAWMGLNRVRVGLWTVQWLAMMVYFAMKVSQREESTGERTLALSDVARDFSAHGGQRSGAARQA